MKGIGMMPPRELAKWAKEEVLDAIDKMVEDKKQHDIVMDDLDALVRERNRVARIFRKPEKQFY